MASALLCRSAVHAFPAMRSSFKRNRSSPHLFSTSHIAASATATTATTTATATGSTSAFDMKDLGLMTSRLGLDPALNRFHAPIVNHPNYSFADWPPNHTFPMDKFDRIANALLTTCAKTIPTSNLPRPLVRRKEDFFQPLHFDDIPRAWFDIIDKDFVDRFLRSELTVEEARYIGFREQTHRPELIERTVLEVAGTVLTCQLAHHFGIAANVAGGTHHASPEGGAGYTILNDLAVATNFMTSPELWQPPSSTTVPITVPTTTTPINRVLVIDCDVHQGDGTAKFSTLWNDSNNNNSNNPNHCGKLFTLSIHCASNYPQLKAHSTYDIGLDNGCQDHEYLHTLETSVNRALAEVQPDLVLYDAGVDVYEHDKLGRIKITEEGIRKRDRWVLDKCVSANIPVAAVVGGGYDKDVDALARRHAIVHEECAYVWRKYKMWKRKQGKASKVE